MIGKILLFIFGGGFTFLGMLYLVQPAKIFKLHVYLRELILNDAYVNLRRKQIGSFLIILGIVMLCSVITP